MTIDVLGWISANQQHYTLVSGAAIFAFAGLAAASAFVDDPAGRRAHPAAVAFFLGLGLLAIVAGRWPTFFVQDPLNPDEAQMLAQAITALHDPVPWRSFDGTTSGPLNTYVLALPALLGQHLTFFGARVVAVLLEFGAIACLYACCARLFGTTVARLGTVAPVAFFALVTQDDFNHYSSEQLSIFLGMLALALLVLAYDRRFAPWPVFATGAVTGALPFAKLQSVPLAAATAAVAVVAIVASCGGSSRTALRRLAIFAGGLATVPVLIVGVVAAGGALRDFWISYVEMGRAYVLTTNEPLSFLTAMPGFGWAFDALAAVALAGAVVAAARWKALPAEARAAFVGALLVLAGGVVAVYAPKRASPHYLLFALMPAASCAAAALGILAAAFGARALRVAALPVALAALAAQSAFARPPYPYLYALWDYRRGPHDPVTALLKRSVQPGDRLAIWGWRPKYFVDTDTLLGTRRNSSRRSGERQLQPLLRLLSRALHERPRGQQAEGLPRRGPRLVRLHRQGRRRPRDVPQLAVAVAHDYRYVGSAGYFRFYVRRDAAGS